jgi:hypothetical protein
MATGGVDEAEETVVEVMKAIDRVVAEAQNGGNRERSSRGRHAKRNKKRAARGKEGGPTTIRADEVLNGKMRPESQVINTEKGRQATGMVTTDDMLIGAAEVIVIVKVLVSVAVIAENEKIERTKGERDEQNHD